MAALISSVMNTKDKVPFYVAACEEMGIEVLPPDVNVSALDFAVVEGKIRFGLNAVKNVGETAARAIVAARDESGPFASLWDFCERVDPQVVNKRALESLVKCGALDSTGASRKGMLALLEQALSSGGRQQADRLAGQASIFDLGGRERARDRPPGAPSADPDRGVREGGAARAREGDARPLRQRAPAPGIRDQLRRKVDVPLAEVASRRDGDVVTVGGIVGALRRLTTRKGDPMAFVRLDDLSGSIEVIAFNSAYAAARDLLEADRVLLVKGRVDHKDGEVKLVALEVIRRSRRCPNAREVRLRVDARRAHAGVIRELAEVVRRLPGRVARRRRPRHVRWARRTLQLGPAFRVRPGAGLLRRGEGAARRGRRRLSRRHARAGSAGLNAGAPKLSRTTPTSAIRYVISLALSLALAAPGAALAGTGPDDHGSGVQLLGRPPGPASTSKGTGYAPQDRRLPAIVRGRIASPRPSRPGSRLWSVDRRTPSESAADRRRRPSSSRCEVTSSVGGCRVGTRGTVTLVDWDERLDNGQELGQGVRFASRPDRAARTAGRGRTRRRMRGCASRSRCASRCGERSEWRLLPGARIGRPDPPLGSRRPPGAD